MTVKGRLKILLAVVFACFTFVSCADNSQNAVYKELLVEARWVHNVDFPAVGEPDSYLLHFLDTGSVDIYPMFGKELFLEDKSELRYIYDPDLGEMAIENYGIFAVTEIDTDKMVLESADSKEYLFVRYKDNDPVAEEEERKL